MDGRGVEISQRGVNECVARGLSVIQGDADKDLVYYSDKVFEFVILSQTLQATRNPRTVLNDLLRIGERAIVSFPNFGYWRVRLSLLFKGRSFFGVYRVMMYPKTHALQNGTTTHGGPNRRNFARLRRPI